MADTVEKQVKTKISFDGEADYKKAVADINSNLKTLNSEMKLVTAEYKANGASVETLKAKQETLQKVYAEQKAKVEATAKALEECRKATGENSTESQKLEQQLNYNKAALVNTEAELRKTATELENCGKNTDDLEDGLKKSGDAATDTDGKFSKLSATMAGIGGVIAKGVLALGAAAASTAAGLAALTVEGGKYADDILTVSANTGIATDSLQKYQYALNFIDGDINTLTKSMEKNKLQMGAAAEGNKTAIAAYERLGVSIKNADGTFRDSETVYWEVVDALGAVTDEVERDNLATDLLGKGSKDLRTIIDAGSEAFKAYGEEAEKMGAVMSGDNLAALGAFDDKMNQLKAGLGGLKNAGAMVALPFLDTLAADGVSILGEFASGIQDANGNMGQMAAVIGDTLSSALNLVVSRLPEFVNMGVELIKSLADGLIQNLPKITTAAVNIIMALIGGIVDLLPTLLKAAVDIVVQLANGLAAGLPQLIPQVVNLILQIVQTLIENIPLLIDAALQLVQGLIEGIIQAIPLIIAALPQLITSIVNALVEGIPILIEGAIQLFMALVQAIPVIIEALTAALPQIIQAIVNGLINGLPMIIEGSIQLFMALLEAIPVIVEALINALPQIVQAIATGLAAALPELAAWGANMLNGFVTIFSNVLNSVIQWGGNMLTQAVTSITAFVNGIINTAKDIPVKLYNAIIGAVAQVQQWGQRVLETAKNGMNMVKNGILNVFSNIGKSFKTVGSNIVNGIWNGISAGWDWLKEKVSNIATSLLDAAKGALGIESPSKKFRDEVGVFMAQGIGVGFEQEMQSVSKQIEQAIPTDFDVTPHVTTGLSAADYANENGQQPTLLSRGVTVIQNIYANTTDYAKQQREAEKNFRMIARTV